MPAGAQPCEMLVMGSKRVVKMASATGKKERRESRPLMMGMAPQSPPARLPQSPQRRRAFGCEVRKAFGSRAQAA